MRFIQRQRGLFLAEAGYAETLRLVAENTEADLVLTSPPYDDARTYGNGVVWSFEDYQALGDLVFAALRPGGHCLMVLDGPVRRWRKGYGTERSFTPWRVMLDWAERVGFRVPDRLCYGRFGTPGAYAGRFRNDWEPLLWFQRPGSEGYFDKEAIAEKARWKVEPGQKAGSRKRDGTMFVRGYSGSGLLHRGTLWDYENVGCGRLGGEDTKHPARFAEAFAEDVVRCFCPADGLVVDPFLGSGTTAVAALRHGRRFIGGDLFSDENGRPWAEIAADRASPGLGAA